MCFPSCPCCQKVSELHALRGRITLWQEEGPICRPVAHRNKARANQAESHHHTILRFHDCVEQEPQPHPKACASHPCVLPGGANPAAVVRSKGVSTTWFPQPSSLSISLSFPWLPIGHIKRRCAIPSRNQALREVRLPRKYLDSIVQVRILQAMHFSTTQLWRCLTKTFNVSQ